MTGRLEVGRIAKSHGLRGEVLVDLITDRTERVAPGSILHIGDEAREVLASRAHQGKWIVLFSGVSDRDGADALRGRTLTAEPIDDPEVLWVHELVGAEVVEVDGTGHGTVESVQANPAHDLLVLTSGLLVPLVFVVESADGRVVIDPPDGLFDAQR